MHTEKLRIFNKYAKEQGYEDWKFLDETNTHFDEFMIHVFNACDLVQEQQQKRIADKARTVDLQDGETDVIFKDSILNPENKIQ
ncbi:hypothetical protein ACMGDK_11255 [Chryseobacterium sp. DT-3]|uniref:hypothetical protein n=1 Tax=Chryseobacterium sp. DT-3 TaxID=3396164 RepID=UPI003F194257